VADWACVCDVAGVQQIAAANFCTPAQAQASSPIDSYYSFSEHILTLGDATALARSSTLGRLLLLGLVSGAEGYFRSVLAGVVRICPLSRAAAGEQQLSLSALDYYGIEDIELALFDRVSLASLKELRTWTKRLLGLDFSDGTPVGASLVQFDRICHLRHASVHAQGVLGSGNVRELGLTATGQHVVELDFAALQQAGAVCHAAVRSYNLWLYETIVTRWNTSNVLARIWADDRPIFEPLFALFRSVKDGTAPASPKEAYRLLPFGVRLRR
jgi:hypothetical protein